MYSLVLLHSHTNRIELIDLFKAAYLHKFEKVPPSGPIDEDVRVFRAQQKTPGYVVDFMLKIYGRH